MKIPYIIYGTAWKKEKTADLVIKAVNAGFRGLDTAGQPMHYNETQVGKAIQLLEKQGIKRSDLFIQTKYTPLSGHDPDNIPYDKNAPIGLQVEQSFKRSLRNLETDYVDSYILHSPLANHDQLMQAWGAMERIYNAGGARLLGTSNCYSPALLQSLYSLAEIKPAVVQNRFYQETGYDSDLRVFCLQNGIVYQAFWTLTANHHILSSKIIKDIAARNKKTEAQIFFRYLNLLGIVPLTGTTSEQHMTEDLNILDIILKDDEIEKIEQLLVPNYK